ncbi:hypothetical protein BpHYR1_047251, partial [Brachionus plicatilis]
MPDVYLDNLSILFSFVCSGLGSFLTGGFENKVDKYMLFLGNRLCCVQICCIFDIVTVEVGFSKVLP